MPREFTHWFVAEKVAGELTGTVYEKPINNNKNLFFLGSNFHDSLFYFYKFSNNKRLKSLANVLHGSNKENTYAIIKSMVELIKRSEKNGHLIAFLAGIITHINTDSVFHPMVFHLAGHYAKDEYMIKANQRHHQIEALMEFYFASDEIKRGEKSLKSFIKNAEYPLKDMFYEISKEFFKDDSEVTANAIISGYKSLALTQSMALNGVLNFGADIFYPVLSDRLKDLVSIRYDRGLIKKMDRISGEISFKNPVSGEEIKTTLNDMINAAVQKSIYICKKIENNIKEKKSSDWDEAGPSLKSGLPGTNVEQMKYFSRSFILD
jgi:hypothetical protein